MHYLRVGVVCDPHPGQKNGYNGHCYQAYKKNLQNNIYIYIYNFVYSHIHNMLLLLFVKNMAYISMVLIDL